MTPKFIHYPKCSTCQKASKWLSDHSISVQPIHIVEQNPSKDDLSAWVAISGRPVRKFFNTSGLRYKALGLKDVVNTASQDELLTILASDGMLVKRPILMTDTNVLIGFKADEWDAVLLRK